MSRRLPISPALYSVHRLSASSERENPSSRWQRGGTGTPPFIAFVIGAVLTLWATYALAGAGMIPMLPFTRYVVPAIAAVFLLRALLFPVLKPAFPGNTEAFWWPTSLTCLFIGLTYLIGA